MNYLELLKGYTKAVEIITKATGTQVDLCEGQVVLKLGPVEILIDPEFNRIIIGLQECYYEIKPSMGAFKNNNLVDVSEVLDAINVIFS